MSEDGDYGRGEIGEWLSWFRGMADLLEEYTGIISARGKRVMSNNYRETNTEGRRGKCSWTERKGKKHV